jgi:hypothetical protein
VDPQQFRFKQAVLKTAEVSTVRMNMRPSSPVRFHPQIPPASAHRVEEETSEIDGLFSAFVIVFISF